MKNVFYCNTLFLRECAYYYYSDIHVSKHSYPTYNSSPYIHRLLLLFAISGVCPLFLVAFAAEDLHSSLEIVSNRLLLAMTALR